MSWLIALWMATAAARPETAILFEPKSDADAGLQIQQVFSVRTGTVVDVESATVFDPAETTSRTYGRVVEGPILCEALPCRVWIPPGTYRFASTSGVMRTITLEPGDGVLTYRVRGRRPGWFVAGLAGLVVGTGLAGAGFGQHAVLEPGDFRKTETAVIGAVGLGLFGASIPVVASRRGAIVGPVRKR